RHRAGCAAGSPLPAMPATVSWPWTRSGRGTLSAPSGRARRRRSQWPRRWRTGLPPCWPTSRPASMSRTRSAGTSSTPTPPRTPRRAPPMRSSLLAVLALALFGIVAAYQGREAADKDGWSEVRPGVFRSLGDPVSYALVEDGHALLIDAAAPPEKVPAKDVEM